MMEKGVCERYWLLRKRAFVLSSETQFLCLYVYVCVFWTITVESMRKMCPVELTCLLAQSFL